MLSAAGRLLPVPVPVAARLVARRATVRWRFSWLRPTDAPLEHPAVPRGARG